MQPSIVLGGGCFWCLDAVYNEVAGITKVVSGYAGGHWPDPTYERVMSGATGHAEVVEVFYDPAVRSLDDILDIFWIVHDPTTPNRQGYDVGTQYRSVIFYRTDEQRRIAEASIAKVASLWSNPILTEIRLLEHFYPAEDYHQDYFARNPAQAYCVAVINPKLAKLRDKFKAQLKDA